MREKSLLNLVSASDVYSHFNHTLSNFDMVISKHDHTIGLAKTRYWRLLYHIKCVFVNAIILFPIFIVKTVKAMRIREIATSSLIIQNNYM